MKNMNQSSNGSPSTLLASVLLLGFTGCSALWAQDNTSTYYTNGLVNFVSGDINVGSAGTNNYLEVSNSTTLTNDGSAIICNALTAKNNLAMVSGLNSTWNVGGNTIVGYFGSDAQLVITNGGTMNTAAYGIIGYYYTITSNNLVKVTGTGSTWNIGPSSGLWIGGDGSDNQLIVENGGTVSNATGTSVGVGNSPGSGQVSSRNLLLVTGASSRFINGGDFIWSGAGTNTAIVSDGARIVSPNYRFYGSPDNQFIITNGGFAGSLQINMGESAAATDNRILVTGAGSVLSNSGTVYIGLAGDRNQIVIDNGAHMTNGGDFMVGYATASNSLVIANGGGLVSPNMRFYAGANNNAIITNGGTVQVSGLNLGESAAAVNNRVLVTGTGSVLNATYAAGTCVLVGYNGASFSTLQVEDGGVVNSAGSMAVGGYFGSTSHSNRVVVAGTGSQLNVNGDMYFGWGDLTGTPSVGNQLTIAAGGKVNVLGTFYQGAGGYGATSNTILVSDAGSTLTVTNSDFMPGRYGTGLQMIVTNGGKVVSANGRFGYAGNGGLVDVTGHGSVWTSGGGVAIGENGNTNTLLVENGGELDATALTAGYSTTGNKLVVRNGGLVEINSLTAGVGAGNSISNLGGIYQFTAAPSVTPNGFGRISITDGTISYRGVSSANISDANVGNIAFAGNNAFRLNDSSNAAVASYTFDSVANTGNPANYQRLELVNGGTRWQGASLTIGSGGALLISNTTAMVAANLVSSGSVHVVNSVVTWASNVVIRGSYRSDPSTNTYLGDLTVDPSGSLAGGAGDLFDFNKSLLIHSTNSSLFDLDASTVVFLGGGVHTNAITGMDLGGGVPAYNASFVTGTNFAYGTLRLGATNDVVCFECGNPPAASNALYVGWLDLSGLTNEIPNVSTLVSSLLHAPASINIYYALDNVNNAYLGRQTYQLLDCNGDLGGLLMPVIPEPSAAFLLASGAVLLVLRRNRAQNSPRGGADNNPTR